MDSSLWRVVVAAFLVLSVGHFSFGADPFVPLHNGAKSGVKMPVMGIGTFGYGSPGEIWNDSVAQKAVSEFLSVGGRRIDTAYDYGDQRGIAAAVKASNVPRDEIFITSKIGGGPLGYNETLSQMETILDQFNDTYVDLILIHWPGPVIGLKTTDPACKEGSIEERARNCRQSSWKAMEMILEKGQARAIGVSNFEQNHLQDIFDMNSTLPAVNQVEFHPYWHEIGLLEFCQQHNITFNSYAPLGTPDWAPFTHNWPGHNTTMQQPAIEMIAKAHMKTPAQVILRWQWQLGIVLNPRTWNVEHMKENLDIFDFTLSDAEIKTLGDITPPKDPKVCPDPRLIP